MSSEDVALYLYQVGSNQRKLEYCRQILASNPNCIPHAIFNLMAPQQPKSTLSKKQFIDLINTLNIACNPQEQELIFSYFQIDGKTYITFDEFTTLITPQTDSSLLSLIDKRNGGQFCLDYSLRFCLQKFFFQVIENQVRLQMRCRFSFEKKDETKKRTKRLDAGNLKQFLNFHGKYPHTSICELILREMGQDKGDNKRNKLVADYILQFNQKMKQPGATLPKIVQRTPSAYAVSRMEQVQTEKIRNKENAPGLGNSISVKDKPDSLSFNHQKQTLVRGEHSLNSLSSITSVEQRINSLMGTISIKGTSRKQSPTKNDEKNSKLNKDDIYQNIKNNKDPITHINKQELQKQKSKVGSSYNKQTPFNRFASDCSEGDLTDRKRMPTKYDKEGGYTDRITERHQENDDHSSSPSKKMKQRIGQASQSSNRDGRINKTRMDYLKSLVAEKL